MSLTPLIIVDLIFMPGEDRLVGDLLDRGTLFLISVFSLLSFA